LEIQRETRRYAKRQMTWFRGDPEFRWFHPESSEEVLDYLGIEGIQGV
jgi:tRNA dimethylallyltransferase